MKKSLPLVLSILLGLFLLVTLVLVIVRVDLSDASLTGLVDSSLGVASKLAGKKSEVPGLIKLALSTPFFIACAVITAFLIVILVIMKKSFSSWFKNIALPEMIDGAILLIASPVAAILYKAKVPKLAQGMIKSLYATTQKLILITGAVTLIAGAVIFIAGKMSKGKR